ncbi:MAG TPA: helix-turn-helix domain-containing protein [Candidatus Korarchaeota archaeon]|nr:helix-turn-helix domain-containing protein [Candidatus Korarchaeota archaeon]
MIAQPCELVVKTLIPAIRAMIARELVISSGKKQIEAAELLGVTQAAISQYLRGTRGGRLRLDKYPEVIAIVRKLAQGLASGRISKNEAAILVCEACYTARKLGVLCDAHLRAKNKYAETAQLLCKYDILREKLLSGLSASSLGEG